MELRELGGTSIRYTLIVPGNPGEYKKCMGLKKVIDASIAPRRVILN